MVFTLPEQMHDLFAMNYRRIADALTEAAAATLKQFQRNNWKVDGGFLYVLHTWGSALNWHPHLHVLVSAGGVDSVSGRWKPVRREYSFPVKPMSKVFRSILLSRLEALDRDREMVWPGGWKSAEERRQRRVGLCASNFNVFSKATLRNTRAVVRYLARYTSRIAMSNARLVSVDAEKREVAFRWKDYRSGGQVKERTLGGKRFIWLFTRHLVPKGYRRVRYFGWLAGGQAGLARLKADRPGAIGERAIPSEKPACRCCQARDWIHVSFFVRLSAPVTKARFSLVELRAGP